MILDIHDTMPELYLDKFGERKGWIGAHALLLEERASAFLADRVLAVHELNRKRLERAGIPSEKIRVVLNSPDPRIFSPLTNPPGGNAERFSRRQAEHFSLLNMPAVFMVELTFDA